MANDEAIILVKVNKFGCDLYRPIGTEPALKKFPLYSVTHPSRYRGHATGVTVNNSRSLPVFQDNTGFTSLLVTRSSYTHNSSEGSMIFCNYHLILKRIMTQRAVTIQLHSNGLIVHTSLATSIIIIHNLYKTGGNHINRSNAFK